MARNENRWLGAVGVLCVAAALSGGTASAQTATGGAAPASGPQLLAQAGDWTAYVHAGPPRLCFVLSGKDGEAKGASQGLRVFVSAWPDDGVRSEVNLKAAAPFRKGSEVSVSIGALSFRLFTQGDRAWVGDAMQELKLIEAMRKGARMIVQGVAEKGAPTSDAISLTGLAQAMQALTQACK